jgi:hypothetical protein
MVTSRTCGRLGNFLFQFAATFCHAKKYGFDYCMPKRSMNERLWPTPRFKNIVYGSPKPGKLYQEKSPNYSPIPAEDNLILEGYWQSEQYWHGFKKELAELLEFEKTETDYVAIHVRRGDYLKFPNEFPVLPQEYYHRGIMGLINKGYKKFNFYSDDPIWCKSNFPTHLESEGIFYSFRPMGIAIEDMREIYNATAFIIANSTYSLFPALLRSDNPLVIAPVEDRWFGPANKKLDSPDRMSERFIKL